MNVKEALYVYYKSPFGHEKVYRYAILNDGIVLFRKPKGIEFSTSLYFVTKSESVQPVTPMDVDMKNAKILDL